MELASVQAVQQYVEHLQEKAAHWEKQCETLQAESTKGIEEMMTASQAQVWLSMFEAEALRRYAQFRDRLVDGYRRLMVRIHREHDKQQEQLQQQVQKQTLLLQARPPRKSSAASSVGTKRGGMSRRGSGSSQAPPKGEEAEEEKKKDTSAPDAPSPSPTPSASPIVPSAELAPKGEAPIVVQEPAAEQKKEEEVPVGEGEVTAQQKDLPVPIAGVERVENVGQAPLPQQAGQGPEEENGSFSRGSVGTARAVAQVQAQLPTTTATTTESGGEANEQILRLQTELEERQTRTTALEKQIEAIRVDSLRRLEEQEAECAVKVQRRDAMIARLMNENEDLTRQLVARAGGGEGVSCELPVTTPYQQKDREAVGSESPLAGAQAALLLVRQREEERARTAGNDAVSFTPAAPPVHPANINSPWSPSRLPITTPSYDSEGRQQERLSYDSPVGYHHQQRQRQQQQPFSSAAGAGGSPQHYPYPQQQQQQQLPEQHLDSFGRPRMEVCLRKDPWRNNTKPAAVPRDLYR